MSISYLPLQVVGGLVVDDDNRVLLALRPPDAKKFPSMWEIPGGKLNESEHNEACRNFFTSDVYNSYYKALWREFTEELGVGITVNEYIGERMFQWDVDLEYRLWHVDVVGTPRPLASVRLEWVDLAKAIVDRPCMPSTYSFYRDIVNFLEER